MKKIFDFIGNVLLSIGLFLRYLGFTKYLGQLIVLLIGGNIVMQISDTLNTCNIITWAIISCTLTIINVMINCATELKKK